MTADTLTDTVATTMHTHPSHWSAVALGAVCALRGENAQPPFDTAINYVGLEHLDSGNPRLERWETASIVVSAKARFQAGDVLYGKLRPYLDKAALAEFDGVCSTDILVLKPMASLDSTFLSFLVHTRRFIEEAVRSTGGVNLPRTSWNALSVAVFPLPPLAEQRAIARILRAAQDAIAARRREVTLERERKAALMQRLFTHGTRGELTKQTEIGEMPQSWQVVRLGELCEFLQYGTSLRCADEPSGLPVLRIPNVIGGQIDTTDLKYLALPREEAQSLILERGDLLFVRTNGRKEYTGRCALYDEQPAQAMFASYLIRTRIKCDLALPEFVRIYTETAAGRQQLGGRASNAADGKYNINSQTIRTSLIALPPLDEQREIADTLAACDTHIAALEREITLHDELFHALLEELMNGRLSALSLVEESASGKA